MAEIIDNEYDKHYDALKNYLKSTDDDKDNILNLLKRGHHVIMSHCGVFDLENEVGRDLVFDYVRFAYNGYREHFFSSFEYELNGFRWQIYTDAGDADVEET